ncbi:hypothetical protein DHEL01_v203026 [Diaporthe helianthi]|uniref:Uncharacterized protein n=1 Tax=Diaporthe helianthi TaxID=158607 RepID=A0A2P5I7V0_DIAHE|nr:hypothetical protein DHEL01_v203026 [Diaporthe helianthi]
MGGKVFSKGNDPLNTPRMDAAVYDFVKRQCHVALKELNFSRVASPIETPEKKSHGDVDILVCLEGKLVPFPPSCADFNAAHWAQVEKSLRAKRSVASYRICPKKQRIVDNMSFAVPWPPLFALDPGGLEKEPGAKQTPRYVQVDVRLCDTHQEMEWRLYKHNHGDLWNMIGQNIRPLGLTADDCGLHIRIPEIEEQDKKKARVLLTSDPDEVNGFLGIKWPNGGWGMELSSVNDLFECAASHKWFMLWPSDEEEEEKETSREDTKDVSEQDSQSNSKKRKTKTKEGTKKEQRPVFARWIDEFIPACRAQGRFIVPNAEERTWETVRDEVRREVFKTFPGKEAEYNARLTEWKKEKARIFVKKAIIKEAAYLPEDLKSYLPPPRDRDGDKDGDKDTRLVAIEMQWRSVLVSALQKIIIDDDDSFEGLVPHNLRDSNGVLEVDQVTDWINVNWPGVGDAAWKRQCARAREHMDYKAARDAGRTEDGNKAQAAKDKKT